MPTKPGSQKTRTEYVAETLRKRILSGEIPGGKPIRQLAVAEELGVSQIPVREALLQLSAQGLVRFETYKGAVAMELTQSEINELTRLRALVETDILASAIPHIDEARLSRAEELLDLFDTALDNYEDIQQWSTLNSAFHMELYSAVDRLMTLQLIEDLHRKSDRYIRLQLLLTDWIPQAEEEHRELLRLCREKQVEPACELLDRHIREAGESISLKLAEREPCSSEPA